MGFDENIAFAASKKHPLNKRNKAVDMALKSQANMDETRDIKHNESTFNDHLQNVLNMKDTPTFLYPSMNVINMQNVEIPKYVQTTQKQYSLSTNSYEIQCNTFKNCTSIDRIKTLLMIYNDNKINFSLMDTIIENYPLQYILNDFIHIIRNHNGNLEEIYNILNIKCNLSKCIGLKRNQRNRNNMANDFCSNDLDDIFRKDIFDQIHCYLLHSFDTGYRLTKQEMATTANNEEEKQNPFVRRTNILKVKWKKLDDHAGSIEGNHNPSKFVTNSHDNGDDQDVIQDELDGNDEEFVYSFGHRYNYWKSTLDHYVTNKFDNFKTEILQNLVCKLRFAEYIAAEKKAKAYLETKEAKKLICTGAGYHNKSDWFYNGAPVSLHHLIAIILYCDQDLLSYKFSTTYRAIHLDENVKEITERHRNYYWFGRYLRELVEGFGKEIEETDGSYYHGISGNVRFTSTIAKFHHPMSTTKQVAVAQRFAGNNGVIISVQMHQFGVPYFDCNWISKYGNEEESLFIGGIFPLQITNIINCTTGDQYGKYLRAMNIFAMALDANYGIFDATESDKDIIESLISGNDDLSGFIIRIFTAYRHQKKMVKMNFSEMVQYLPRLASILLTDTENIKDSFVNLSILRSLFPRCHTIQFNNISISEDYIVSIEEQLLSENEWIGLQRIEIRNISTETINVTEQEKKDYAGKYDEIMNIENNKKKYDEIMNVPVISDKKNNKKKKSRKKSSINLKFFKRRKKKEAKIENPLWFEESSVSLSEDELNYDKKPNMDANDVESAVKDDIVWYLLEDIINKTKFNFEYSTNFKMNLQKGDRFNRLIISRIDQKLEAKREEFQAKYNEIMKMNNLIQEMSENEENEEKKSEYVDILFDFLEHVPVTTCFLSCPINIDGCPITDQLTARLMIAKYRAVYSQPDVKANDPAIPHFVNLTLSELKEKLSSLPWSEYKLLIGKHQNGEI